jgi:phytoene synthase
MSRAELVARARQSIRKGSKSFAAASLLFDRTTRERVWLLYAWCRACDDLADAQDHGGALGVAPLPQTPPVLSLSKDRPALSGRSDGLEEKYSASTSSAWSGAVDSPEQRLALIRERSLLAFAGKPTGDFAFDALGVVARETGLTSAMAEAVIAGFALDTAGWEPRSERDLMQYCWHVAGAVGVMMAVVMGVAPDDEDTLDRAADLGFAFQLANIARDLCEDDAAGRCYVPLEWLVEADIPPGEQMKPNHRKALVGMVARMCEMARAHEASARIGAARLAPRQRWAVLAAAGIYGQIARMVEAAGEHAWDHRAVVPVRAKLGWIGKAGWAALRRPPANSGTMAEARRYTRRDFA